MKKIELLAPAGDMNKLKTAVEYGADAVYLGGESFGLRKTSKNFSVEDIKWATNYLHERGKKIHVTLNIIPHDKDIVGVEEYIEKFDEYYSLSLGSRKDLTTMSHVLFTNLRKMDKNAVDIIIAEGVEDINLGKSIMNRMKKSASGNVYYL